MNDLINVISLSIVIIIIFSFFKDINYKKINNLTNSQDS